jgi:hypothetical protein
MSIIQTARLSIISILITFSAGTFAQTNNTLTATPDAPPQNQHIYLLIGQSNMAGRAPFTKAEEAVIERCYLLNNHDEWEPAKNPLNRYSSIRKELGMQKMGPGYSFAKTLLGKNRELSIGLVVNAQGGSKIEEWRQGGRLYSEAIRRTKIAQKDGTLMGILWHQGASNEGNPDGYLEKLKTLVTNLRTDLNAPNLPFVAGQINNLQAINKQIAMLPQSLPKTGTVSSKGLTTLDRWHFDAKSMRLLGRRYADEMIRVQNKAP